jgi:hypothetical protein
VQLPKAQKASAAVLPAGTPSPPVRPSTRRETASGFAAERERSERDAGRAELLCGVSGARPADGEVGCLILGRLRFFDLDHDVGGDAAAFVDLDAVVHTAPERASVAERRLRR